MAILKILNYPHPKLREMCEPITEFDSALKDVVHDLVETMYASPGAVGLSAPQIGYSQRIFAVDVTAKTTRTELKVMINPVITVASRNKLVREGCLSFPEYLANVKRAQRVVIEGFAPDSKPVSHEVTKLEAVAMQHELDHLDGVLMIDKIQSLSSDWIRRESL